jgi:circadian clock protein KaiC
MTKKTPPAAKRGEPIAKAAIGIVGLDEVTGGGLPRGRPTLVVGGPGCGNTMLAAEFIVQGATRFGENGVFMMFEENAEELAANVRSLGFDLDALVREKKVAIDYVRVERSEIEETGLYDLDGLFIRLAWAIESVGARRVVLDTIEALFSGLDNHAVLRAELRRLFRWLKDRGMTAIITSERGATTLTRYGLEEYVADCVIELDHRVTDQISTRRLRVVKYRGSPHGTNEYPFLIGHDGISVLPITSLRLDHDAPATRLSTGIAKLDEMLGGKGVFRGSSVLVSGTPGTGKSSIGASVAAAACGRGERVLLFAYEESASQLIRNMKSIGVDLGRWTRRGLLQIHASRPTLQGLEQHLVFMYDEVREFAPDVVVVDPISNLGAAREDTALRPTLMRLIDFLKQSHVTGVFTSLVGDHGTSLAETQIGVSSLMDTWLLLSNLEANGERTRTLQVVKSRGMPHSNQVREFVFSDNGVDLIDVYVDDDQVLTGRRRIGAQRVGRGASVAKPAAARRRTAR